MKRQEWRNKDRKVASVVVFVMIVSGVTFSAPIPAYAAPITYADPAGNCGGNSPCHTTIAAALNDTDPNGTVYVYAATYTENVSIGSGVNVTLLGATNLNGSLTIGSGTTFNSTSGIFNLSGNWINSGTFNHNNGTVRLNGSSGTQTISGNTTFYDLTIAIGSGVTADFGTSSLGIVHNLARTTGTGTMNPGTGTITFTGAPGSITGANAKTFYNLVIDSGANITNDAGNLTIRRDFTNNGTFTQSSTISTTFDNTSTTHTLAGSGSTTFGSVSIAGGTTVNAGSHNITVCGSSFSVSNGGAFNGGTATVTIDGTTALNNAGAYNFNSVTINAGRSLSNPNNRNFSVSGNWTNNGTFSSGTGTVTFNGTSQTLTGSTTFNNLTTNSGTTLDTGTSLITVNGTLTNNGALRHTTPAQNVTTGGGTFSFLDAVSRTTAQLTQTGGSNMGNTTLVTTAHIAPTNYACGTTTLGGAPVRRLFDLTPTNTTGVTATLRLYFYDGAGGAGDEANGNTLSNIAIFHCNGTYWSRWSGAYTTGTDPVTGYRYVELPDVTEFSPFAIGGGPGAPTAVTLSDFTARTEEDYTRLTIVFSAAILIMLAIVLARRA